MIDKYSRLINYARISVTDLCNLRCRYCMPDGVVKKPHMSILSLEELGFVSDALAELGVIKQRVTGGEPLVRRNVISLFKKIGANKNVETLGVTTNGIRLSELSGELKNAGVTNVNISIDTLDDKKFRYITKIGELADVKRGIFAALEQGFDTVKLNTVLLKGINDDEVIRLVDFAAELGVGIRFIELMPFCAQHDFAAQYYISSDDIVKKYNLNYLSEKSVTKKVSVYATDKGNEVGFISPVSNKFCAECNRVRITADGKLLNCLHESVEYDLKPYLSDMEALKKYIVACVACKPKEHLLADGKLQHREMDNIGG